MFSCHYMLKSTAHRKLLVWCDLGQPLLTLCVSRLGDGPLSLFNKVGWLIHDVTSTVQCGITCRHVVCGGSDSPGSGCQGFQSLGHVSGCHAWIHNRTGERSHRLHLKFIRRSDGWRVTDQIKIWSRKHKRKSTICNIKHFVFHFGCSSVFRPLLHYILTSNVSCGKTLFVNILGQDAMSDIFF